MLDQVFTPDGSIVDGEIVDHKNGTYEFVYTVPKEGDFSLALRLYDQHIKGSPFKLTINRVSEAEVEVGSPKLRLSHHLCTKLVGTKYPPAKEKVFKAATLEGGRRRGVKERQAALITVITVCTVRRCKTDHKP